MNNLNSFKPKVTFANSWIQSIIAIILFFPLSKIATFIIIIMYSGSELNDGITSAFINFANVLCIFLLYKWVVNDVKRRQIRKLRKENMGK